MSLQIAYFVGGLVGRGQGPRWTNSGPNDPWWVDLSQAVGGIAALAAAGVAAYGIVQGRRLADDRRRERRSERTERQLAILQEATERLTMMESFVKANDGPGVTREQRRIRVVANHNIGESWHELLELTSGNYRATRALLNAKDKLLEDIDAGMEAVLDDIRDLNEALDRDLSAD